MRSLIFFIALTFIIFPSTLTAAPAISTATNNGDGTYTLSGSGFGTFATYDNETGYLPTVWEDMETGAATSKVASTTGLELVVGGNNQRTNSGYCGKGYRYDTAHTYTNIWGESKTTTEAYECRYNASSAQSTVFISGWFMFPSGFATNIAYQSEDSDQTKFLRISPDGGPTTYFQTRSDGTGVPLRTETEDGDLAQSHGTLASYSPEGEWHRFDIYSDITQATGYKVHKWYVDGYLVREGYYNEVDGNDPEAFTIFGWLGYQFAGDDTYTWPQYVDDMYLSFTQARVELSAEETWDETTQIHKELQIPISWETDGTGLSFKVNQGSFGLGDTVYLFVVDADGAVSDQNTETDGSQGYPVTFLTGAETPTVSITSEETASSANYTLTGTAVAPSGQTITSMTVNAVNLPCLDGACDEQIEEFSSLQTLSVGSGNVFTIWANTSGDSSNFAETTVTYTPSASTVTASGCKALNTVKQ